MGVVKSASASPLTVKDQLNYPDPNTLADILSKTALGDLLLGQLNQTRRAIDMTATAQANDGYNVSTLSPIVMRSNNIPPAASIIRATVRAGGVTGELAAQAYGTTPTTGQIAVAPNGSIVTLTTDAITNMDVIYVPERGIVVEYTGPVASATGVMALPTSIIGNGIVLLLEAEVLAGAVVGKKVVVVPGGTGPATLTARLAVAKTSVNFNQATDTPTRARIKILQALPAAEGLISTLATSAISP